MHRLTLSVLLAALLAAGLATAATADDLSGVTPGPNANLGGARLMPDDSPWNADISGAEVDPKSDAIIARIGKDTSLHADFGGDWEGVPIGIPYVVVDKTEKKVPVAFDIAEESDAGPYPIPPDAPIEGGPDGDGDRHVLVLDRDSLTLYELFDAYPDGAGGWKAGSGAKWDLEQNQVRPDGWTSADAAGLPILPGLARYDEAVETGEIKHALRFTLSKTRRAYVPPASHWASEARRTRTCRPWACACASRPITTSRTSRRRRRRSCKR